MIQLYVTGIFSTSFIRVDVIGVLPGNKRGRDGLIHPGFAYHIRELSHIALNTLWWPGSWKKLVCFHSSSPFLVLVFIQLHLTYERTLETSLSTLDERVAKIKPRDISEIYCDCSKHIHTTATIRSAYKQGIELLTLVVLQCLHKDIHPYC